MNEVKVINISINGMITSGGVCDINQGNNINISNSLFENISSSINGGALLFKNITNKIIINKNNFINISSIGDGGGIYFSLNTYFEIIQCYFDKCRSEEGYGGAITSISTSTNSRLIEHSNFSENSAYNNIGIDIYDISNYSRTYYTRETIINCSSTSTSNSGDINTEYILFAGTEV
jgi:hypothetical protein